MSTAFTSDEGGWLVEGPSVARACLHALAAKLHRLADTVKASSVRVLHGLRSITTASVDAALTTVATVRSVSGLGAAVSLIMTSGQILIYALTAITQRANKVLIYVMSTVRRAAASLPVPDLSRERMIRWVTVVKNPWVAGVVAAAGLVMAGVLLSGKWIRNRGDLPVAEALALSDEEIERIMVSLYVTLGADGSVHVHGMPMATPIHLRDRVARLAADAATQRLDSLVRRGRPLSTLDLQAVNVAARSAVARQLSEPTDTGPTLVHAS